MALPAATWTAEHMTSQRDDLLRPEAYPTPPPAVVAIEADWLERVRMCRLYLYRMPGDTFEVFNRDAGYAISRVAVSPESVEVVDDAVRAIVGRGVELRVVPSLWPLRDAVLASTLSYSFIRMRHAAARVGEEVGDG